MPKCRFYGLFSFIFTYIHILSAGFSVVRQTIFLSKDRPAFFNPIELSPSYSIKDNFKCIGLQRYHFHQWEPFCFGGKYDFYMKMVSLQPYAFKIILDAIRRRQFNRIKERRSVLG
jgi:hypothetical protein